MMEDQLPLTSPDGSSNGNPPERCPRPLDSQDSTQKDPTTTPHDQKEDLNVAVKKEIKEENGEGGVMEISSGYKGNMTEATSNRNSPQRCPRPLDSQETTREGHTIPDHDQRGVLQDCTTIKQEIKEEEMEDQPPLTSPDESSNRNPPQRCPRPLDSMEATREGHTIPHNDQRGVLQDCTTIKQEIKEEMDEGEEMEDQPPLTSPDGSSNRNPPERCPCPLDSTREGHTTLRRELVQILSDFEDILKETEEEEPWMFTFINTVTSNRNSPERCPRPLDSLESTLEGHTIPHHDQTEELQDFNVVIKKEIKEEHDKDDMKNEFSARYINSMTEPVNHRNPAERCPHPLDSQESTQEGQTIPHHHQDEGVINVKAEKGELYERDAHHSLQEKPSVHIGADGHYVSNALDGNPVGSLNAHNGTSDSSPGLIPVPLDPHHRPDCENKSLASSYPEDSFDLSHSAASHVLQSVDTSAKTKPQILSCDQDTRHKSYEVHQVVLSESFLAEEAPTHERPFQCSQCGKCFSVKKRLLTHQTIHTGERPYSCSECGKCFTDKRILITHLRIHTGERPFSCDECGKCFTQKGVLIEHRKIHTGERPFTCGECGKSFTHKENLLTHQRSHTGERRFSCAECGKSFTRKESLLTHKRSHTGECPFSCAECGKCFSQKVNLVKHQRTHTGERPFSCAECGKSFTQKGDLARHQACHTGERPFACLECGKCFKQKVRLLTHQRLHTDEIPFSCSECGKGFKMKCNLTKHQKTHTC